MVYPEGRCLVLNMTRTDHMETTLILKFENTSFRGKLELTITDPHREYYRPDIFSFSGERIIFDFSKGLTHLFIFVYIHYAGCLKNGSMF